MAKVLVSESNLTNIANAIRAKNGSSNTYTPAQMAPAIQGIQTGMETYTCTYPTSIANQSLQINLLSSGSTDNGVVQFDGCGVELKLVPNSGYDVGSIVVDGVDTGSDVQTINPLTKDTVISVTNATEHQYLLNTTANVVYQSSSSSSWGSSYVELRFTGADSTTYSCMAYNPQTDSSQQVTCELRSMRIDSSSSQTLAIGVYVVQESTDFYCNTKIILNDQLNNQFSFGVNLVLASTYKLTAVQPPSGLWDYLTQRNGQTISLKFDYNY